MATYILKGIKIDDIREALETFIPSPGQTPGRMNIFKFHNFEMLVDYAHNAHGLRAISKFLEKTDAAVKTGIITVAGDRRNEDIVEFGEIAGAAFDEMIIRHDKNRRGRDGDELTELLIKGIRNVAPNKPIHIILDEMEAVHYAIANAKPGSHITLCSDAIADALELIKSLKEKESLADMENT